MLWPTVTELPRHLEPTGDDTFVRDLDEFADQLPAVSNIAPSSVANFTHEFGDLP